MVSLELCVGRAVKQVLKKYNIVYEKNIICVALDHKTSHKGQFLLNWDLYISRKLNK